ncbi:MAG: OB-fold nucleic acid binding domain-containing protein [Micrococcales bacterium]|nr:OB-fold nucleic acid binding domain-containing protein [Micrococcales bacterium]MCL2668070.1 OB-fold nucleic acid binding domain-containing protein [Micrococcales bacterium]
MTLRERVRSLLASRDQEEADQERADALAVAGSTPVAELSARHRATASGVLRSVTLRPREGVPALEAELYDGSGALDLVWLGRREIPGIVPGRRVVVEGMVTQLDGRRAVYNPRYQLRPRPGE